MSIDAARWLAPLLAQTGRAATRPADDMAGYVSLLILAVAVAALPVTLQIARRKRLGEGLLNLQPATAEQSRRVLHLGSALLLGVGLLAVGASLAYQLMGGAYLIQGSDAARRVAIMAQPAGQIAGIAAALGALGLLLPDGVRGVGLRLDRPGADLRWALAGYLMAVPWVLLTAAAVNLLVHILGLQTSTMHEVFELWEGEQGGLTALKLITFLGAALLAPIIEELLFRGLLQNLLLGLFRVPAVAIGLTSLAFAAIHSPWTLRPPIFVLSVVLGWTYFRTGSLLAVMLMHLIFNVVQFALFLSLS